ncbi:TPA: DNA-binding protein [Streptococcus suis]|uniref:DNA-binding protein n=1 Tax=Streptococcus suis TaxID=1307 RepID=UPI00209AC43A|nr:DNA-binding protein [Streptococcus suis]MCO8207813.1 DNA-binding protein [Streptococcus suis]MCO8212166.1 DNA-binding protein [Streptococcus suis]HEM3492044.1 DNA-binding protein [Streptococcus suis]HEM3494334.1 DNA-binding protein [Streptococcus suis]
MSILSRETELDILGVVDRHLDKRLELEKQKLERFDLIPADEVADKLNVSGTTLRNWENVGLQRYQSPFENSKKVFYRASDLYKFLAVE